ncbi:hypothetical protein H0E87_003745 [Populus deltoides]|uniref:Cytochrome P450 n=1 Tax=Populus deltoides TaxID=3696 RepID=A0A8T2ZCL0_POPDE|nr:hypothetical protein H0E87_003745 [Populus deltoides]
MEMWSVCFSVLIGETLQFLIPSKSLGIPNFLIPSKSLDIPNFIKKRIRKYDPLSRTSLVGRPVIVSSDPDFNYNLLQQEGKLVERWYMDSFAKLLHQDVTSVISKHGSIHKYLRNLVLAYFGPEPLKDKLLPKLETAISQALQDCYESEKSGENIAESFTNFLQGLMSIPLNIPGTAFHRCLKNQKRAIKLITDLLEERRRNPGIRKGDFLDQIVEDMQKENFWTDECAIYMMFGLLLASFETISSILALAIKFLTDHPPVVQKLTVSKLKITETLENKLLMKIDSVPSQVEHERRKGTDSGLPGKNINP